MSHRVTILLLTLLAAISSLRAADTIPFDSEIQKFEADDREQPPARGQVLFVGSSSIRMWNLEEWFGDWDALNRGFGGSQFPHVLQHFDRVVAPYAPRAIVLYCGDNDINAGRSPEQVFDDFQTFVKRVQHDVSETSLIVYIPIKPSRSRWHLWDEIQVANELIADYAKSDSMVTYVDIVTPMLANARAGQPPPSELFQSDGLHLSKVGYAIWADALGALLEVKPISRELHTPQSAETFEQE